MKLRPHHFLCIQKFTGHGYDKKFTDYMKSIIKELKKGSEIVIEEGCDYLCSECPNKKEDKCNSFDKVKRIDEGVLDACGFHYNQLGDWAEFASEAKEKILDTDFFKTICHDCEWYELCLSTEEDDVIIYGGDDNSGCD